MSNLERTKKIHKKKHEDSDKLTTRTDAILSAYKFSCNNAFAFNYVFPEYFPPGKMQVNEMDKVKTATFVFKNQHTVQIAAPHAYVYFFPLASLTTRQHVLVNTTANQQTTAAKSIPPFSVSGLFDSFCIASCYLKIVFTRTTCGYAQIANCSVIEDKIDQTEEGERMRLEDSFIIRYRAPDYSFNMTKPNGEPYIGKVIHLFGLEHGLVLDIEMKLTLMGTVAKPLVPSEYVRSTKRSEQRSNVVRAIKRILEKVPDCFEHRPLINPISQGFFDLEQDEEADETFLFPDKNVHQSINVQFIPNLQTTTVGTMVQSMPDTTSTMSPLQYLNRVDPSDQVLTTPNGDRITLRRTSGNQRNE